MGREGNELKTSVDEVKEVGKIRNNCKKTKNSSRIKVYSSSIKKQGRHNGKLNQRLEHKPEMFYHNMKQKQSKLLKKRSINASQ